MAWDRPFDGYQKVAIVLTLTFNQNLAGKQIEKKFWRNPKWTEKS